MHSMQMILGFLFPFPKGILLSHVNECFELNLCPLVALDKYKARLITRSFLQKFRVDYSETFSLIIKPTTIRVVLTLVLFKGWKVR